ncbi:MAG: ferredoxin [Polyangiales bacterium]
MKIKVDWDLCKGHGECEGEAPEVFELDDDGNLQLLTETPDESLRAKVERAVKYCPTLAIAIED